MTTVNISRYAPPRRWIHYDKVAILEQLVEAKTASGVLRQLPYLPQWIETVHQEQLRLEATGTSRIEGAEFTPQEENEAPGSRLKGQYRVNLLPAAVTGSRSGLQIGRFPAPGPSRQS